MSIFILLLTLTPEGRKQTFEDANNVLHAADAVRVDAIQGMGLYGVLGEYDFVYLVDAPDNEAIARFSLELGVRAGVSVTSLPAIPIAQFEGRTRSDLPERQTGAAASIEDFGFTEEGEFTSRRSPPDDF